MLKFILNILVFSKIWDQPKIIIGDLFAYNAVLDIFNDNEKFDLSSLEKCWYRIYD